MGNPGPSYRHTRHNVGYLVADRLVARGPAARSRNKFHAEVFEIERGLGESWLVLKPQTFMNRSGLSVAAAVRYYELDLADLMVVCDDFHLPLGRLRIRRNGSDGGQRGLADIIVQLGTNEFPRLRLGITAPDGDPIEHVLGTFRPDEAPVVNTAVGRAVEALDCWAEAGLDEAMNRYNAVA